MIRALFFDIDGTLVSFNTHSIPHSTVQALQTAKAKGIKIFISTGRPYALINNLDAIKHLITANGAYCFVGEEPVSCTPIPANEVEWIINQADAQDFACIVVGQKDYTTIHPSSESERIFKGLLNVPDLRSHVPLEPGVEPAHIATHAFHLHFARGSVRLLITACGVQQMASRLCRLYCQGGQQGQRVTRDSSFAAHRHFRDHGIWRRWKRRAYTPDSRNRCGYGQCQHRCEEGSRLHHLIGG